MINIKEDHHPPEYYACLECGEILSCPAYYVELAPFRFCTAWCCTAFFRRRGEP